MKPDIHKSIPLAFVRSETVIHNFLRIPVFFGTVIVGTLFELIFALLFSHTFAQYFDIKGNIIFVFSFVFTILWIFYFEYRFIATVNGYAEYRDLFLASTRPLSSGALPKDKEDDWPEGRHCWSCEEATEFLRRHPECDTYYEKVLAMGRELLQGDLWRMVEIAEKSLKKSRCDLLHSGIGKIRENRSTEQVDIPVS